MSPGCDMQVQYTKQLCVCVCVCVTSNLNMKFNVSPVLVASEKKMEYLGINFKIYMCGICTLKMTEKYNREKIKIKY